MRSFALSFALVTPFVVGCGDNLEPDEDPTASVENTDDHHGDPLEVRPITHSLLLTAPSCDAVVADFEIDARYADDFGTIVPSYACTISFDDGTVYDQCIGSHTFADGGFHGYTLEVRDLDTGATATDEGRRYIEFPLLTTFEAQQAAECAMEISYTGTVNVSAFAITRITPAENAVGDAFQHARTGSFQVTQPGTYELTFHVEDERSIPICQAEHTVSVTVAACPPDDHDDHEPGCGHM